MDRQWLPLNALRAFEAAGRLGSFTAAAASLTVAQSAVSRHVIALERFLGVPLFERRPGQLALTEAGRHLLPAVTRGFDRIDRALGEIIAERGTPRRMLRLALPPTFALQLAVPILRDFRAEHPELAIEIASRAPGRRGGRRRGRLFRAQGVGRHQRPPVDGAARRGLRAGRPRRGGAGPRRRSWRGTTCSTSASAAGRTATCGGRWRGRRGGPTSPVDGGLVFDTAQLAVQYALSGDGLALVDPVLFRDDLAAGRLVAPFETRLASGYGYYLVTAPEDLDEAVALFRSWLIRRFAGPPRSEGEAEAAP